MAARGYGYDMSDSDSDFENNESKSKKNRRTGRKTNRFYGFFHCRDCGRRWESSQVYVKYRKRGKVR